MTAPFNTSICQAQVPNHWKEANVIPIPNESPIININSDLCPISLTATLLKIFESFPAKWIMDSIYSKLDPKQFASLKGCSAMDALISMFHCLYSNTDSNGKTICIFLLDFSKAFDRINRKILVKKCSYSTSTNP